METRPPFGSFLLRLTAFLIATAFCGPVAFAQTKLPSPPAASVTTAKGLSEDWRVLKQALTTLHPGIYRYNTPAQMDKNFDELKQAWSKDQTLPQAYGSLSVFLAKIKCGHTYANFFNQNKAVTKTLFEQKDKVPFYFCWIDGQMIVTRDETPTHSLPLGTEIQAINGVPTKSILQKLLAVTRSDGSNDAKRIANLEVSGSEEYEAFDVFYPLFYPVNSSGFVLDIRRPSQSQTVQVREAAYDHAQRISSITSDLQALRGVNTPLWQLKYLRPDVAYLEMKTWELYNSKWDWKTALNTTFDELTARNIPNLVIDLRANEGGNAVGDVILHRLTPKEITQKDMKRRTAYRKVPDDLRPYLSTWDASFYDWGEAVTAVANGLFEFNDISDASDTTIRPSPRPFRGKVFVVVGPNNSSATFSFARQIQSHQLGTLIGRPTGGNLRGINGGAFLDLKLPNSRIEVDIPLIGTFPLQKQPDAGLSPDVAVKTSAKDVADGKDVELERTLQIINKANPRQEN